MSDVNIYRASPRKIKKFALKCLYAGLVPYIQSSPGMGKSSIVRTIARELNLKLIDHRLSTSAPEDLSGLPRFNERGEAVFAPFAELFPIRGQELPDKHDDNGKVIGKYDGWLVFLDEFNSASKSVQAAAYKLILDRMVGQQYLHDNCLMACAGNLATDRAIVNTISTAMQSRVIHLEMEVDFDDWLLDVALPQNYDSRIIAYLSQHPSKLMDFNPQHNEKTFSCPRTWGFMNSLIKDQPVTDEETTLYAGTITSGVATNFVQFTKVYSSMPKVADILADPESYPVPTDMNTKWATVSSLLEHVTEDNLDTLSKFVDRMDTTFRILFYRSVMVRQPQLRHVKAFTKALVTLQRYLQE